MVLLSSVQWCGILKPWAILYWLNTQIVYSVSKGIRWVYSYLDLASFLFYSNISLYQYSHIISLNINPHKIDMIHWNGFCFYCPLSGWDLRFSPPSVVNVRDNREGQTTNCMIRTSPCIYLYVWDLDIAFIFKIFVSDFQDSNIDQSLVVLFLFNHSMLIRCLVCTSTAPRHPDTILWHSTPLK